MEAKRMPVNTNTRFLSDVRWRSTRYETDVCMPPHVKTKVSLYNATTAVIDGNIIPLHGYAKYAYLPALAPLTFKNRYASLAYVAGCG